jgi:hypothetical protein
MKTFKQYLKEELESKLDFKRFDARPFYIWVEYIDLKPSPETFKAANIVMFKNPLPYLTTPLEITDILGQPEILGDKRNYKGEKTGIFHFYWGLEFTDKIKAIIGMHFHGTLPPKISNDRINMHLDAGTEGKEEEIMQRIKDLIKIKKYKLNKDSENMFGNILKSI